MKSYFSIILVSIFALVNCGSQNKPADGEVAATEQPADSSLRNNNLPDEGFIKIDRVEVFDDIQKILVAGDSIILKENAIRFLNLIGFGDSTSTIGASMVSYSDLEQWDQIPSTERIGKYYTKGQHTYSVLIKNPIYALFLIFEIDLEHHTIYYKEFGSGTYHCCWDSDFDGFRKMGDYFYVKTCGTGSAYCAGDFYLFKDLQDIGNQICESAFCGLMWMKNDSAGYATLSSDNMQLKNDRVKMHYFYETGVDNGKKRKRKKTINFDIEYVRINNNWVATDSTMLKAIDIPM